MSETVKKPSSVIGLRNVVYCIMTDEDNETYSDEVKSLVGAIDAKVSTSVSTDTQYADDGAFDTMDNEGDTIIDLQVVDVPPHVRAELLGKFMDDNGVVIDTIDNAAPYVAVGFMGQKVNKKGFRYVWLYKVKFVMGEETFHTKEQKGTFQQPTLKGTAVNRIRDGRRKAVVDSDGVGKDGKPIPAEVTENWFKSVYEYAKSETAPAEGAEV